MKTLKLCLAALAAGVLAMTLVRCDMVHINDLSAQQSPLAGDAGGEGDGGDNEILDGEARDRLEAEGHFLKLLNMPSNTGALNVTQVTVANSAAAVAKRDEKSKVKIFLEPLSNTVYIPLVYTSGAEFTENGFFYVILTVHVDALKKLVILRQDNILVEFAEGRGTLDVLALPEWLLPPGWFDDDPADGSGGGNKEAVENMEKNGRYLKLERLPRGALAEHISDVRVTDGSAQAARVAGYGNILIDEDSSFSSAYIPLVAQSGAEFTRSGDFFVEFAVKIDAVTRIVVRADHRVLVRFSEGRGTLNIEMLVDAIPDVVETEKTPEDIEEERKTEEKIEAIIAAGGYIRFFNLARNISASKFSNVSVADTRVIALCPDYESVAVRKNVLSAEAFVPLSYSGGGRPFLESGSYLTSFTVTVDALTRLAVSGKNAMLLPYADGVAEIDATCIPDAPDSPPSEPHALTITGLPETANASNFSDVVIYNSQGAVAKCADYTKIAVTPFNGKKAALIPLVYDNNRSFNGQPFADSGGFIVAFLFFSDVFQGVSVLPENNCVAVFADGCGAVDFETVPAVPRSYLTITGLPPNIQELDVSEVFVWNQAGKTGKCEDYSLLVIQRTGAASTLRVPLSYQSSGAIFGETGSYYVTFDLNIDALVRITVAETDRVTAYFTDGNATLDAANLPQALPTPYLTVVGLPKNAAKNNFSDVFLYNAAGKIAKCADYLEIVITKNSAFATAMIPLVYSENSKEYFRDSGSFVVTFTANVDINTVIGKALADTLVIDFTDGSGTVDLLSDYGYFSGGLKNPLDASPPVIAKGTSFEMNGGYVHVKADTSVKSATITKTSLVYVYASLYAGNVEFEYSLNAPVYDAVKKGWYRDGKRALYKLVYIKDAVDKYAAKTYIADSFTQFDHYTVTNPALGGLPAPYYSLSGAGNPEPKTVTLPSGVYLFVLTGGGGGGGGVDGTGDRNRWGMNGGAGGAANELATIAVNTSFTFFAGQGGAGAGYITTGSYQGTGGGGGGSGTFVYSVNGYFLCAGGGGGGGGTHANDGGGAGGGAGSGGGGGGGGAYSSSWPGSEGGAGGAGGGYLGGAGGWPGVYGNKSGGQGMNAGYSVFDSALWGYNGPGATGDDGGGNGGNGGAAAYRDSGYPEWSVTVLANGMGGWGAGPASGSSGGADGRSSRDGTAGGGAAGGAGGAPSNSALSAGAKGGDGSIIIYRIF